MNSKKIMDLQWTFEMTTLHISHREHDKCGLKKNIKVMSK